MSTTTDHIQNTPGNSIYDTIVSGAGPVGLFLACELALAGCSVLVLEKAEDRHSPLKQLPFGLRGLNAPSIQALDRRGLLQELHVHEQLSEPHMPALGQRPRQKPGGHFAGIQFQQDNIDTTQWKYSLPGMTETMIMSEMEEIETALSRRAAALGVHIRYGLAVTDLHQAADSVTVHADDEVFTGKWLVGCDGSRSVVRKAAGFEFAGTEPEFTGYTVKADIADPEQLKPGRNVTPTGMYLLSQPGYLMMQDFDCGAFHSSGDPVTRERVQELLRRISGTSVTITALHLATTWTDRARQATAYRNGRVLLAGDAAHIHSPLGGQGLNLGLGDAMNLGWKLATTIQDRAPEGLLDSYHTERYPVGAQVLDWSRAQVAIMGTDPASRALHAIVRDIIATRDGTTYFAGRVWGISTQYSLEGAHPLTGYSVPNFEFEDGTKIADQMHNGLGILLDFDTDPALKAFTNRNSTKLRYIPSPVKDRLGLRALLIRPDGIVAWATDNVPDMNELQNATARWFTPN